MSNMQPLRDEHRELLPHIDELRSAAEAVGVAGADELRAAVERSTEFLTRHLLPHAGAEDQVLYPAVQRVMGAPRATATMSRDHVAVEALTTELVGLRDALTGGSTPEDLADDLRRVLYGLHALVSVHFAKEEEIYVPLLEAGLSDGEAAAMFEAMHHAAHELAGHH